MHHSFLRYSILGVALIATLSLHAQASFVWDFSAGAGYSSLGYKVQAADNITPSTKGSYGANLHTSIGLLFCPYFGMNIGADFSRYGQSILLTNSTLQWDDVTDTDAEGNIAGEKYNHHLDIYSWKEKNQQLYLAPQLTLVGIIPLSTISLSIEAGVEYAFCMQSNYSATGDIEHTGIYPKWGLTLHDMPAHGFYRTTSFFPSGDLSKDFQTLSLVGKIGVIIPIAEHWDIRANVLCKYALSTNPKTTTGGTHQLGTDIGFHDDQYTTNTTQSSGTTQSSTTSNALSTGNMQSFSTNNTQSSSTCNPHYFMPNYSTLTNSTLISGNLHPLLIGVEIGIRYHLPFTKRTPKICRCEWD